MELTSKRKVTVQEIRESILSHLAHQYPGFTFEKKDKVLIGVSDHSMVAGAGIEMYEAPEGFEEIYLKVDIMEMDW